MNPGVLKTKDLFRMPLQPSYFQHATEGIFSGNSHFARKMVHIFNPAPSENRPFHVEARI
jgi:hypothetical protein